MKKLDKLENEFLPQVMVDTTEIIFDTLKFLEPSSKELIIANTGQVNRFTINLSINFARNNYMIYRCQFNLNSLRNWAILVIAKIGWI